MKTTCLKRFRESSDPFDAERVKSIKVLGNWDHKGGTLDKMRMTYHSSVIPSRSNVMGLPMTVNRPLTLQLDNMPPEHEESVAQAIRGAHEIMARDPNHPAALANYGSVNAPPIPHGPNGGRVVAGMEHVSEDQRASEHLGCILSTRVLQITGRIAVRLLGHRMLGRAKCHNLRTVIGLQIVTVIAPTHRLPRHRVPSSHYTGVTGRNGSDVAILTQYKSRDSDELGQPIMLQSGHGQRTESSFSSKTNTTKFSIILISTCPFAHQYSILPSLL
jgi:hypothetical protein